MEEKKIQKQEFKLTDSWRPSQFLEKVPGYRDEVHQFIEENPDQADRVSSTRILYSNYGLSEMILDQLLATLTQKRKDPAVNYYGMFNEKGIPIEFMIHVVKQLIETNKKTKALWDIDIEEALIDINPEAFQQEPEKYALISMFSPKCVWMAGSDIVYNPEFDQLNGLSNALFPLGDLSIAGQELMDFLKAFQPKDSADSFHRVIINLVPGYESLLQALSEGLPDQPDSDDSNDGGSPEIDAAILDGLTATQKEFAYKLLEIVFVDLRRNISGLTEDDQKAAVALIKAVPDTTLKSQIFNSINPDTQPAIAKQMDEDERLLFFSYCDDFLVLKEGFSLYDQASQPDLLKALYQKNRLNYKRLKRIAAKTSIVGGQVIERSAVGTDQIKKEIQDILNRIEDKAISQQSLAKYAIKVNQKFDIDEKEGIIKGVCIGFYKLNPQVKDKASFYIHLKFYHFISPFVDAFPDVFELLNRIFDQMIQALCRFPNAEWVIKVLNQMPMPILKKLLEIIWGYEKIASFEKRNMYCKLFNNIKGQLHQDNVENIEYVISLL